MTLQTLAGEWPFRMSFTDPPLMCSTAASIDDRKNLGKSQVKVHLHSQDIETSCQQTEQYCKDCHQRQCASWLMNSHSDHTFFFSSKCLMKHLPSANGPFTAERSCGTQLPNWRANEVLEHVRQSHQIWIFFVPVRHLLTSLANHVIAQLQRAHCTIIVKLPIQEERPWLFYTRYPFSKSNG